MAGPAKSIQPKPRQRVEADTSSTTTLKRAQDGSAFTRCGNCNKNVPVVLIDMHNCSLDSKIRMNLEAQVVEKEVHVKKAEKKRPSPTTTKEKKGKKVKQSVDPNKPKRPLSAYFLFMEDFRKTYKEENPDSKGVTGVTKEAGAKWKSMTDEEKKDYNDRAAKLKEEYLIALEKYNAGGNEEEKEGSDKEAEEKMEEANEGGEEEGCDKVDEELEDKDDD